MSDILVQFVGAGDAFGSGGRFQTCIALSVDNGRRRTLLDCGASSLIAMKRLNIDPVSVDAIILTHLHGDHFGGIPFVVLDAQFARRERPLLIVGPPGTADRVRAAMEIFFPGSVAVQRGFALQFLEIPERTETVVGPFTVTAYAVVHASGAPSYAVRLRHGSKVIAYSGDTEWTDALIDASRDADLFIVESYFFGKLTKYHLNYAVLQERRSRLQVRRLIVTHMHTEMLAHLPEIDDEAASDGLTVTI